MNVVPTNEPTTMAIRFQNSVPLRLTMTTPVDMAVRLRLETNHTAPRLRG